MLPLWCCFSPPCPAAMLLLFSILSHNLYGQGPSYLRDRISLYMPCRALHSNNQHLLVIPGQKDICLTSSRVRAFSALAPAWQNMLLLEMWTLWDLLHFHRAFKLELFCKAFCCGMGILSSISSPHYDMAHLPQHLILWHQYRECHLAI